MKRAIIVGATSGIGREVALCLLRKGWLLGIAGRREAALVQLQETAQDRIVLQPLDVTQAASTEQLERLIAARGGMDLFFLAAGIGRQNPNLKEDIEVQTAETNTVGFTRMVTAAFRYFRDNGGGHIAVISSIAGVRGLGAAPAYSATKRFQNTYIDALSQLSRMQNLNICFTDIRPGFVNTSLLNDSKKYPMLMSPEVVAGQIVRALEKRKRSLVIDWRYRVLVFFWRLVPEWLWERLKIRN